MNYLSVFLIYYTSDWASARWASACTEGRAGHAASWSGIYHMLHGVGVLFLVRDPYCCIFIMLGSFLGTWSAIRHKQRKKNG